MAEAVVVVPPAGRREQDVQRRNRRAPAEIAALLQPLCVLYHHRRGHHREGLVGREEPVATTERVALQPALTVVLAQPFHHAPIARLLLIAREGLSVEAAVLHLEHVAESVRV